MVTCLAAGNVVGDLIEPTKIKWNKVIDSQIFRRKLTMAKLTCELVPLVNVSTNYTWDVASSVTAISGKPIFHRIFDLRCAGENLVGGRITMKSHHAPCLGPRKSGGSLPVPTGPYWPGPGSVATVKKTHVLLTLKPPANKLSYHERKMLKFRHS